MLLTLSMLYIYLHVAKHYSSTLQQNGYHKNFNMAEMAQDCIFVYTTLKNSSSCFSPRIVFFPSCMSGVQYVAL